MTETSLAELHDDLRSAHALLDGLRQGEEKRLAIYNEIRAEQIAVPQLARRSIEDGQDRGRMRAEPSGSRGRQCCDQLAHELAEVFALDRSRPVGLGPGDYVVAILSGEMREHVPIFRIVEREPGITLVAQTAIDIDVDPGLTKRVLYR